MTEVGEVIDLNGELRRVVERTAMYWNITLPDGTTSERVCSYALITEPVEKPE